MALSFASATGNYFNRLGKLGLLISQAKTYQTSQQPNLIDVTNGVVAQFNGESDIQALIGSSYIGQLNSVSSIGVLAQQIAGSTVNRMVYRDNPRLAQNLQSLQVLSSLQEVIRQMKAQGASVLAMTITATPSSFTGTGNGAVIASIRRPLDGLVLENSFAETMQIVCNSDSYIGSASAGNEGFVLTGAGAQSNAFSFDWPLGSNASAAMNAIDGATDNGNGNTLTNSDFQEWTSNVPDNWELIAGTAGTNIAEEASLIYTGSSALQFIGDGSTLTQIRQTFNTSTGTTGNLEALSQYSFNCFMRRDGTAAAAGVLTVDLVDGSGNVIQDAAGNNNSFTIDLTALSTSYNTRSGVFRTPLVLPSTIRIRIRMSTALTNSRSVYMGKAGLGLMTQTYTSGPYISVHSGSTNFVQGDYGTIPVTNSRGSGGTLNTFQTLMARLYTNMLGSGLLLPSSATPNVSDSLIG